MMVLDHRGHRGHTWAYVGIRGQKKCPQRCGCGMVTLPWAYVGNLPVGIFCNHGHFCRGHRWAFVGIPWAYVGIRGHSVGSFVGIPDMWLFFVAISYFATSKVCIIVARVEGVLLTLKFIIDMLCIF